MKNFHQVREEISAGKDVQLSSDDLTEALKISEKKKFNSAKELSMLKRIDSQLAKLQKEITKLQAGMYSTKGGNLYKLSDGLVVGRRAIEEYEDRIRAGELDD